MQVTIGALKINLSTITRISPIFNDKFEIYSTAQNQSVTIQDAGQNLYNLIQIHAKLIDRYKDYKRSLKK